jgi:hypothetical protein
MANLDDNFQNILAKVEALKQDKSFDLSVEEDLSLAVMNLISLEEHFFFTSQKTKNNDYLDLLSQTREIRKELLGRMIDQHEGETWCIAKHLLATTMRLMEVATKLQTLKKKSEAEQMFATAYKVYTLFWGIRLHLIDLKNVSKKPSSEKTDWTYEDIMTKLVDCCKE